MPTNVTTSIGYEYVSKDTINDSQNVIHISQLKGLIGILFVNCVTAIENTAVAIASSIIACL